jgi:hypothetical protein
VNILPSVPRAWLKPAFFLGAGLLLCPSLIAADMLAVAAGHGNIYSQGSDVVFLSYQKYAPKLFNRESLYDLMFGYWSGSTHNSALTLARVVRWKLSNENYFAGTLGIGVVDRTTDHLGTTGQFVARLAFGRKFGKYDLSIGETHYSNGKTALQLNWHGPNTGEDFLAMMLAREF